MSALGVSSPGVQGVLASHSERRIIGKADVKPPAQPIGIASACAHPQAMSDPRATVFLHAERTNAAAEATQAGGEAPELPPVARWPCDRVGAAEDGRHARGIRAAADRPAPARPRAGGAEGDAAVCVVLLECRGRGRRSRGGRSDPGSEAGPEVRSPFFAGAYPFGSYGWSQIRGTSAVRPSSPADFPP